VEKLARATIHGRWIVVSLWLLLTVAGAMAAGKLADRWFEQFSIPGYSAYEANQRTLETFGTGRQYPMVAVFQVETGGPSHLIQLVTLSPFNHVGIVSAAESPPVVYEALGTVRTTTLGRFIDRRGSLAHRYRVMRLRTPLSPARSDALLGEARRHLGRRYDVSLSWSDEELNCSEYAWKVYARGAGVELSRPRPVGDHPVALLLPRDGAAEILEEKGQRLAARVVRAIDPEQPFVSPADLSRSDALEIVWTNLPFESTHHRPVVTLIAWGVALLALVAARRRARGLAVAAKEHPALAWRGARRGRG